MFHMIYKYNKLVQNLCFFNYSLRKERWDKPIIFFYNRKGMQVCKCFFCRNFILLKYYKNSIIEYSSLFFISKIFSKFSFSKMFLFDLDEQKILANQF